MKRHETPLYNKLQADALREQEVLREEENREKFALLLDNLGECGRLVDIGCGWGQFLQLASAHVAEIWGVDESPDRLEDTKKICPQARAVISRADRLDLPDGYFDVAVTSQMLHEVKLFGSEAELRTTLYEIRRVLAAGGRYLLLDHQDAGDGEVTVGLPDEKISQLVEFEQKYKYYQAGYEDAGDGTIRISKRCLQDFLTKAWSLNSPMESMEMNETHNVFDQIETTRLVEAAGFAVKQWISFSEIGDDLKRAGGEFVTGENWFRKFLLIARRV